MTPQEYAEICKIAEDAIISITSLRAKAGQTVDVSETPPLRKAKPADVYPWAALWAEIAEGQKTWMVVKRAVTIERGIPSVVEDVCGCLIPFEALYVEDRH